MAELYELAKFVVQVSTKIQKMERPQKLPNELILQLFSMLSVISNQLGLITVLNLNVIMQSIQLSVSKSFHVKFIEQKSSTVLLEVSVKMLKRFKSQLDGDTVIWKKIICVLK